VAEVPAVEATTDVVVETAEAVVVSESETIEAVAEVPVSDATTDVVVETAEAVIEAPVAEEATEEAPKAE